MKKNILLYSLVAVGLLAFLSMISTSKVSVSDEESVFTYGPNHTVEREAEMVEVMESKDFEAWKALMTEDGRNPGVLRKIDTQEKFEKFAEAFLLTKEGETDEVNALRSELGLGEGKGNGGSGNGGSGKGGSFVDENGN